MTVRELVCSLLALMLMHSAAPAQPPPLAVPQSPGPLQTNPMTQTAPLGAGSPDRDYMLALISELHVLLNERDRLYMQKFQANEQAVAIAFESSKLAVDKAQQATDKHFDSVNEFRNTLRDQTSTFIPRAEFSAVNKSIEDKLKVIDDRVANISAIQLQNAGKSEGANSLWVIISVAAMIVIQVGMLMWNMRSRRSVEV